jgi:uncharacterized membrane protein
MLEFFTGTVAGKVITTFLISMVPVVELRGAIPYGVAQGLPVWLSVAVSICGNMLPVPFIIIFIRRIFAWIRRRVPKLERLVERLERKALKKRELILRSEIFGLILLVAIPLPGTGAWTGALVAAIFDLRIKSAVPAILAGVIIAGAIVGGISAGVLGLLT